MANLYTHYIIFHKIFNLLVYMLLFQTFRKMRQADDLTIYLAVNCLLKVREVTPCYSNRVLCRELENKLQKSKHILKL